MKTKRRIGILTGGGDCPGINAVIRSVAKNAILEYDIEVVGIKDGYEGIGFVLGSQIEEATDIETRTVVMGHLQRSGVPTPFDRVLATKLGCKAIEMITDGRFRYMVGVMGNSLVEVPLEEVAKGQRNIPSGVPLIKAARSVGTCFGD